MDYYSLGCLVILHDLFSLMMIIFLLLLFSFSANISASHFNMNIPRLGTLTRRTSQLYESQASSSTSSSLDPKDFETFYYTQTLDHFNYRPDCYFTFQQKYVINSKYWGGPHSNAPIFAYLGAEAPLDSDLFSIGFLSDNALQFQALQVYIEVRIMNPDKRSKPPQVSILFHDIISCYKYNDFHIHILVWNLKYS